MTLFNKIFFAVVLFFAFVGVVFSGVFIAMQFGLLNVRGSSAERDSFFTQASSTRSKSPEIPSRPCNDTSVNVCTWAEAPEWGAIAAGFAKDKSVITRVAGETGVPARLIMAVAAPEQMRFFTSEREVFKKVFEPLKILGSMSQFSLGVSGMKQETAAQVEKNALDSTSSLYSGTSTAALIAYPEGADRSTLLYNRLTDPHDHYYSYLYTALFIRQIEAQWQQAGFDISNRPDIIATLFNIGFRHSEPHPNPEVGGAAITIGGTSYVYGELAGEVYRSGELENEFPIR